MGETQSQLARGLEPKPDLRLAVTNKALGALAPSDSNTALFSAWLKFDVHDTIVTSPTVLGYSSGRHFLAVLDGPRTPLVDQPIQIQE